MNKILFCLICSLAFSVLVCGQAADTYDIATFRPPPGWSKTARDGGVLYSKQTNAFAMIVVYRSAKGLSDAKSNFDADWRQFAAGAFGVKGSPQMEPARSSDGWTIVMGASTFDGDLGKSAIVLSTYSGFGTKFSVAAIFNSQDYVPAIEAFAGSIVLRKATAAIPDGDRLVSSIVGTWGKQAGVSMRYGDAVAAGNAGYGKDQYTFNADGTYAFVSKTFRMSSDKILLVKESGTYQINGKTILIDPRKSVIEAWSKLNNSDKWGRLLSTQGRPLEKVAYRFTKHYFSGLDLWNLVLQADKPTERDGPFNNNTLFANAWYYAPISSVNPVIQLP